MPAATRLSPLVLGIYAVAGALLLLLLIATVVVGGGTLLGLVAVGACGAGYGLSWLLARAFGGPPWLHALALVALPLAFALYSAAAHDHASAQLRVAWLALLAVIAVAGGWGARRGLAAARADPPD